MERWIGKVACVSGASSGIGRDLARLLAAMGMRVIVTARRIINLQELEKENKGFVKAIQCDVTKEEEVKAVFKWAEENWGAISVQINCAGYASYQPLQDCSTEELRKIFETNVIGLSTFAREALKSMTNNSIEEGHVININSYVGHLVFGLKGMAPYCASKNAVTVLTESLRRELGPHNRNIRVTSLSPGLTETGFVDFLNIPKETARLQARDVSDTVLFILSTPKNVNVTELTLMAVGDVIY